MNKKLSFLAASMAIALAGCGGGSGSDNDGSTPEGKGIVITGFDGYFKNAVVFEDFDNDGILDDGEKVFGLTNAQGKLTLPADTKVEGSIALQTFKPGGISESLAKRIAAATPEADTPTQILNIFTTDMDHPNQPMANSVVFRAPAEGLGTNAVISPITDLVSIEVKNGKSLDKAKLAVSASLGLGEETTDLFSDFVQDAKTNLASAQLHKTAQILTETKAKDADAYEAKASQIADVAKKTSEELVTEQNMASEELLDVKPVIDPSKPSEVKTNYKLLVVDEQKSRIANEIAEINLTEGARSTSISLVGLFEDKFDDKGSYEDITVSAVTINAIDSDVSISFSSDTQSFDVTSTGKFNRDLYIITVTAFDRIAKNDADDIATPVSVTFEMKVELPNEAPQLNAEYQSTLQTEISKWMLIQGKAFTAQLDMWDLFTDREGDVLDYIADIKTVIPGLTSSYDATTGVMTISGRPAEAHTAGKTFNIVAEDNVPARIKSEPATFTLPVIHQGDITVDTEAKDQLQKAVNQWQLKVLEPFNQTLNISSLFSGDESGEVEYYANYAAHDNTDPANPIPGVDIEINHTTGDVTLSGTPTSKTNGVVLYLAKGINYTGGADNDVESEMVKIVLPNVQAADLGSIDINHAAKSELQTTANGWANELQVGVRFEKTLDIRTLFVDEIAGKAEYYANYAANDNTTPANPIYGVKVSVNNETGVVTLVGTPTKVATDVKLYLAKGYDLIDDNDIDVESEMVVIDLPVVQPGEEGTDVHPLVGKKWYVLENGRGYFDENGAEQDFAKERVWCETYEFKDGKVYGSNRTEANLTTCTPEVVEFTGATYEVYDDELIVSYPAEDAGGDAEEIVYQVVEANNVANAQTVVMTELNSKGHEVKSRYTYFSDATDAQKRINIKSDSPWHQREVPMYIPGDLTPLTVSITLESTKAYINFDADGKDFTCDDFKELYSFSDFTNGEESLGNGSCNEGKDTPENGEVTYQYASVFFNLNKTLESVHEGDVFSAIVNANSSALEPAENVRFNIEWTGKTYNE